MRADKLLLVEFARPVADAISMLALEAFEDERNQWDGNGG